MNQPERRTPISATMQLRVVEAITGLVARTIAGLLFIAGGGWLTWFSLEKIENHTFAYVGIGAAVLGALFLPSVFDIGQKIFVMVFPNGLPVFGGRRSSDPKLDQTLPPKRGSDTDVSQ